MIDRTANLLGAVGLAVADRTEQAAREVLGRAGETPAALVVIGYGTGPSNEGLRRILGLSHPGSVRLVDRLVADGLVERHQGRDKRQIALHLTTRGAALREDLLKERLAAVRPLLSSLTDAEQEVFAKLLRKMLSTLGTTNLARCALCRLCDDRVCTDCPIQWTNLVSRQGSKTRGCEPGRPASGKSANACRSRELDILPPATIGCIRPRSSADIPISAAVSPDRITAYHPTKIGRRSKGRFGP